MSHTEFAVDKDNLEVRTSRIFSVSKLRLWEAITDPKYIPLWWGPAKYTTKVDKHDFRVGGEWRFVQSESGTPQSAFGGVFTEIVEHESITDTFEFELMPGHVLTETMTLEELEPGKTKLTAIARYANLEDLNGMVDSGMEGGQRESFDRLAALVSKQG